MARPLNQENKEFWEAKNRNAWRYKEYYERLMELAISMFEWKNLPKEIDERFLELALYSDGHAVFFKDNELNQYLALRAMLGGPMSVYNIPTRRTAYASNGYNNVLDEKNSVIIYNNMLRTNTLPIVETYARRLWDLDCAIDVNAKAQKTPILIIGDDTQRLTLRNLYMQYDGNMPFIFGYKDQVDNKSVQVLKTDAPYVADKLQALKTALWNEILTALGITNVAYQKKERMIKDEVFRSQGGTIASRYSRLNARRYAAEQINEMFGLNISVDFRADFREYDREDMYEDDTSEEETVSIQPASD